MTKTTVLPKMPLQPGDVIGLRVVGLQKSWVTTLYVVWDESSQVFYLVVNSRVLSAHRTSQEAEKAYKALSSQLADSFQSAISSRLKD